MEKLEGEITRVRRKLESLENEFEQVVTKLNQDHRSLADKTFWQRKKGLLREKTILLKQKEQKLQEKINQLRREEDDSHKEEEQPEDGTDTQSHDSSQNGENTIQEEDPDTESESESSQTNSKTQRRKANEFRLWMDKYERLKLYKSKHNHTRVPRRFQADPVLGQWVTRQRQFHKQNKLPPKRVELLEEIDFEWDGARLKLQWEEKFERLKAFKKKYKHTLVPRRYHLDPKLGQWVTKQRQFYKSKTLQADRVQLLEGIDFEWDGVDRLFLEQLDRLKVFKKKYKHTRVPQQFPEDRKLGRWVNTQRTRHNKDLLSAGRVQLLQSVGFDFS